MENQPLEKQDEELMSLNRNLFNEFSIQELEERLETDPLLLSNLFGMAGIELFCACNKIGTCADLACGCNGVWNDTCGCDQIQSCPRLSCGCDGEYQ